MAVLDADAIAMARALWPAVTVDAASDAFLTVWLRQVRVEVDEVVFGVDEDIALGHLLAHHAYRVNPADILPAQFSVTAGEAASVNEGGASIGATPNTNQLTQAGRDYSTTPPGRAYLALHGQKTRASRLGVA